MTPNRPLAGLRVLLVEDEMLVSLIVEDLLTDEDCIIVGPYNQVSTAVEAAKSEPADVALLDVNVNGVKVYPVAEILAKRDIPFLFLSGYGDSAIPADRPEWVACRKPFKAEELISMLTERLKSARRN